MQRIRHWLGAIGLAILVAGCGGGGGSAGSAVVPPGTVDASGASVDGPDGSRVEVPAGAVQGPVQVTIAKDATSAPGLASTSGFRLVSNIYTITPHGQTFAKPVKVTLPLDESRLGPAGQLVLLKAQPGGDWVVHTAVTRSGATASIEVRDFSVFALAQRSAEPFRFNLAVTGTKPDLTVTYQFTGQRPVCSRGLTVQTVFRYEYRYQVLSGYRDGLGFWHEYYRIWTDLYDQQLIAVPGGLDGATAGHKVTQPMLPPENRSAYLLWTPFVEGRVLCNGEVLTVSGAGSSFEPQTWTYRSENMPQLASHTGPVAILDDIAPVQATVGSRSTSAATVQLRSATYAQGLALNSRWDLSRDNGTTWGRLSNADEATPMPEPGIAQQGQQSVTVNGRFRLGSTLPDLPLTYNGTLVRVSACVDPGTCALGAARTLSVSAVSVAPTFTREPASTVVVAGAGATFTAVVSGTPAPGLQWQRASGGTWVDIPGATGGSYSVPAVTFDDDGAQFRVVATNSAGSLTGAAATLNVVDQATAPRVVAQSGSLTVITGGSAVFAAQVTGTAPLSYQWRRNGTAITGTNGPILRLDDVSDAQAGSYTLEVSNPAGAVVGAAQVLTVSAASMPSLAAPSITTPPASVAVTEGNGATFGVGVTGGAPMSFQWRKNATDIPGATAATYTLPAVVLSDGGSYSVRVSNPSGSVVSAAAALSVSAAPATPPPAEAPTIVTQPGTVVAAPGMGATLAVTVAGSGPFTYEWLRNGAAVPGQTAAAFTVAAASQLDADTYVVRVTNSVGTVSSGAGQLILLGAPSITTQPANALSVEGSTARFSVAAGGTAVRYQWTRNNTAIPDATAASYTTPVLALADNGVVYGVIVYNGAGLQFSVGAVLTITAAPPPPTAAGTKLSTGRFHTCAVTASDAAACWGDNANGQLGTGSAPGITSPFVWTLPEPVRSVAAGFTMSCALTATSGRVFCSGSVVNAGVPTEVAGLTGVTAIAAGAVHACALKADGTVWCWGGSDQYELGNGINAGSFVPVQVLAGVGTPLTGVVAIDSTERHTCAVRAAGSVACWGATGSGRLGWSGGATPFGMAGTVPNLDGVTQVATGSAHTCVRRADGSVRCWGGNNLGQLGLGYVSPIPEPVLVPTAVPGLSGVASLGVGIRHTCAVLAGGGASCWGSGWLGSGILSEIQSSPVAVTGLTGVAAIDAGDEHSCALRADGTLTCWGSNFAGQLGTGGSGTAATPVAAGTGLSWWKP